MTNDLLSGQYVIGPTGPDGRSQYIDKVSSCGTIAAATVAQVLSNVKATEHSIPFLAQLVAFAKGPYGVAMLDTLISVAGNNQATEEARVASFMALLGVEYPGRSFSREQLIGGFSDPPDNLLPVHGCSGNVVSHSNPTPVSQSDLTRIRNMARQVAADASAPLNVRTAATCAS